MKATKEVIQSEQPSLLPALQRISNMSKADPDINETDYAVLRAILTAAHRQNTLAPNIDRDELAQKLNLPLRLITTIIDQNLWWYVRYANWRAAQTPHERSTPVKLLPHLR